APAFSIVALQKKVEVAWWLAVAPPAKGVLGPPATLNSQGIAQRKSEAPQNGPSSGTVPAGASCPVVMLSTPRKGVPVVALPPPPGPRPPTGCDRPAKGDRKLPVGVTTLATVPSPNITPRNETSLGSKNGLAWKPAPQVPAGTTPGFAKPGAVPATATMRTALGSTIEITRVTITLPAVAPEATRNSRVTVSAVGGAV